MDDGFDDGVVVVGKLVGAGVGNTEGFALGEGLGIEDGLWEGSDTVGSFVGDGVGKLEGI